VQFIHEHLFLRAYDTTYDQFLRIQQLQREWFNHRWVSDYTTGVLCCLEVGLYISLLKPVAISWCI